MKVAVFLSLFLFGSCLAEMKGSRHFRRGSSIVYFESSGIDDDCSEAPENLEVGQPHNTLCLDVR